MQSSTAPCVAFLVVAGGDKTTYARATGRSEEIPEKMQIWYFRPGWWLCECLYEDLLSRETLIERHDKFHHHSYKLGWACTFHLVRIHTSGYLRRSSSSRVAMTNPGPGTLRTNRETNVWLKELSSLNLSMRENLEQAKIFFGGFEGDHKTF